MNFGVMTTDCYHEVERNMKNTRLNVQNTLDIQCIETWTQNYFHRLCSRFWAASVKLEIFSSSSSNQEIGKTFSINIFVRKKRSEKSVENLFFMLVVVASINRCTATRWSQTGKKWNKQTFFPFLKKPSKKGVHLRLSIEAMFSPLCVALHFLENVIKKLWNIILMHKLSTQHRRRHRTTVEINFAYMEICVFIHK